ncbi:hypothetical protein TNCV_3676051 [Trichonephila clavipes]|nr:hypothetical protein TNCV_3969901 [Trichonephila clavipes]GFU83386.1 hypothetical protein TNCV_3676051 [Trichonephila clavipes]
MLPIKHQSIPGFLYTIHKANPVERKNKDLETRLAILVQDKSMTMEEANLHPLCSQLQPNAKDRTDWQPF